MRRSRLRRHPPAPPTLPADKGRRVVPAAVREFVSCQGRQLALEPGPLGWMELSVGALPTVMFGNGMRDGTVRLTVTMDVAVEEPVRFSLVLEVRHGRLRVDSTRVRDIPGVPDIRGSIEGWVRSLNLWLDHRGERLAEPRLENGRLLLAYEA